MKIINKDQEDEMVSLWNVGSVTLLFTLHICVCSKYDRIPVFGVLFHTLNTQNSNKPSPSSIMDLCCRYSEKLGQ